MKRLLIHCQFLLSTSLWCASALSAELPFPRELTRPAPITMANLETQKNDGVSVLEVSDYIFGGYKGDLVTPPNADLNPRKAIIITWKDKPFRFVFAHEQSYCPFFEFPSGAGVCYQFLEGNRGWAELFNKWGRQERNSFVDILEAGPERVWVRWTYFGVNMATGQPAYRATEDFWTYPNGLVLRRQTYRTLLPGKDEGYAREPIELIGMCPVGKRWFDVLKKDPATEKRHALAALDPFSPKRFDVYWTPAPDDKTICDRSGSTWQEIDDSAGVALVIPMREGATFCIFGNSSGYRQDYTHLKEHSFPDTRGNNWGSTSWDHWPIGWLNSQAHIVDAGSLQTYPNHFSPAGMDFFELQNEVEEQGIYYSLCGVGGDDMEAIRSLARRWLAKGPAAIIKPSSIADLPALATPKIDRQSPK